MNLRAYGLAAAVFATLCGQARSSVERVADFPPNTVFAVSDQNQLLHFDAASPGRIDGSVPITNLEPSETILAIDFRPSNGQLYGIGSTSRLYLINVITGKASAVGAPFTPALLGVEFGFDFNPVTDQIRVVSDNEQNLRINPDTGAVIAVDSVINPAGNVVGSAYTNNFAGATTTTLYAIDSNSDQLLIQNPPNNGIVSPIGSLGIDTSGLVGFDIAPNGTAYASLTDPGMLMSSLYTVNLSTGLASLVGSIGSVSPIRDIAVVTGPERMYALTVSNRLLRFESNKPGAILSTVQITGLQSGENILGIDFRPANGLLYGLGSTSRLYQINTSDGSAAQVGSGTFSTLLDGTDFGFDFNPTVDRIRVVSDNEQNLRVNPNTGSITAVDTPLNPAGNVVAAAYTNNFAGANSTTLYDIDSNSDLLLIQNPPNNGSLSAVGSLNVDATGLTGFDIAASGMAFVSLTTPAASSSNLYAISLGTGATTLIGTIGGGELIRDIAIFDPTEVVYGVTQTAGGTNNLITFNAAAPGILLSLAPITGLQVSEVVRGMDFRPSTGDLYAIGSTSRLYTVSISTGVATAVGAQFTTLLNGTSFGMDFNPMSGLIRVVSDAEQNLRVNSDSGAVQAVDSTLNPGNPNVVAAAYTNNFTGTTTTTLYDIDSVSDQLFTQAPPNNGILNIVGSLGVDIGPNAGFDISKGRGTAFLSGYLPAATNPSLFTVNLATGAATLIGTINTTDTLLDISIRVTPGAFDPPELVIPITGITSSGNDIVISFNGIAHTTYRLQRKLAITDGAWSDIPGVSDLAPMVSGVAQITDPNALNLGKAFYRLLLVP